VPCFKSSTYQVCDFALPNILAVGIELLRALSQSMLLPSWFPWL
jgi:hypothetical protein